MFFATADAATPTVRNMVYGGVDSRFNVSYQPEFQQFFYVAANGAMNLANFKLTHSLESDPSLKINETYSFEQMLGFGVAAGYQFARDWGVQVDWSYSGKLEDEDDKARFVMSSQNLMLGLRYTIRSWTTTSIYTGISAGVSFLKTRTTAVNADTDGQETQKKTTFAAQATFGIQESLTNNLALTLEYGLMYSGGMTARRHVFFVDELGDLDDDTLSIKVGNTLVNSFRLGMKYRF